MRRILVLLAFGAQLFAAEVPVAEPQIGPGTHVYTGSHPDVAVGDAGSLVVWERRLFGAYPAPLMFRTYDRNGVPHRPTAMQLGTSYNRSPHVVWTGSEYLVVYARWLSRFGSPGPVPALFAARITAEGVLVEDSEVMLAEAQNTAYVEELIPTGNSAIAAATIENVTWLLYLSADGSLTQRVRLEQRPADIATGAGAGLFLLPERDGDAVAVGPEKIAIVDNTGAGVVVAFQSLDRKPLEGFLLAPQGKQADSIAWDGSAWVTAYIEGEAVCSARFTSASDVVRSCNSDAYAMFPAIDAHHGRTLTAWTSGNQILTGNGMASEMIAAQGSADATVDPTGLLVVWRENEQLRIGGPGRPARTHVTLNGASQPRVATAGAQSLLVWVEAEVVWSIRLDAQGNPMFPLAVLGSGTQPAIATDGTNWLVAWWQKNEVVSTLLTPNLDSNGLQHYGRVEAPQRAPVVAATPTGYLVAWNEGEYAPEGIHDRIVVEPLDRNGQRISGGVRVADRVDGTAAHANTLAMRCMGERCLVAWDETAPGRADLASIVVGPDGQPLSELRTVPGRANSARKAILPFEGGGFRLYSGNALFILGPDGELLDAQKWTADDVDLGAAVLFGNRPHLVYSRAGRVFVRDFGTRARAARH